MAGYNFACKSIGMDCGFEFRAASSKAEALEHVVAHAKNAHQITTITPDLAKKVDAAIRQ
jgi:predicted small metal-binding protein